MQTKLTLRLEDALIERAKAWARARGVSLSQVVASVLEQLPACERGRLSSWTVRLVGCAVARKGQTWTDESLRRAGRAQQHERRGRPGALRVGLLEEKADLAAVRAALAETRRKREKPIPWERARKLL
jgi:hypothetical protein